MGNTPNLILPYPELSDTADVPRDIKALADAVDTSLYDPAVPVARAHLASTLGLPTAGAWTTVPLTTVYLAGGFTFQSGQLKVPTTGYYLVQGRAYAHAAGGTGWTGTLNNVVQGDAANNLTGGFLAVQNTVAYLAAFDIVEVNAGTLVSMIVSASVGGLWMDPAAGDTSVTMCRVAPV